MNSKFEEVKMYKITDKNYITYGRVFELKRIAEVAVKNEELLKKINRLFEKGKTFGEIEETTGYNFGIYEENSHMRDVNKDNCFVISHWQCFKKPAYKICWLIPSISSWGDLYIRLHVIGKGGWTGYYGESLNINSPSLKNPRPKEEFEEY